MLETLQQTDQQLLLFLNGFHSPFWDNFMWIYTAKLTWIPMYAAILYVICRNFNLRMTIFTVIAIALTITFADQICATVIRPMVERMRPSNPNNPISELIHIVNGKRGGRYGFPSCHASNSFGLAFFVMFFFKNRLLTFFILLWAAINCYSRIYIGVHYPGDLLGGTIVGFTGALLLYSIYRWALTQPKLAAFLKYSENKRQIEYPATIQHTRTIIYVGLLTTLIFTIYSVF